MSKVIKVQFNGRTLSREADPDAQACLHCGADRDRKREGRKLVPRFHPRPFFAYDYTGFTFCNKACLGAFWDDILRRHGKDFQEFTYRMACSPDIPDHVRRDKVFLTAVWAYARELAGKLEKVQKSA